MSVCDGSGIKRACLWMGLVLLLAVAHRHAMGQAAPPALISFQGKLTSAAGAAQTGSFDFQFGFYDVLTGGAALLTDTQDGVSVSGGIYNINLGGGTLAGPAGTLSALFATNGAVYLEVKVKTAGAAAYDTLSPRTRITSAAYALNAGSTPHLPPRIRGVVCEYGTPIYRGFTASGSITVPAGKVWFIRARRGSWEADPDGVGPAVSVPLVVSNAGAETVTLFAPEGWVLSAAGEASLIAVENDLATGPSSVATDYVIRSAGDTTNNFDVPAGKMLWITYRTHFDDGSTSIGINAVGQPTINTVQTSQTSPARYERFWWDLLVADAGITNEVVTRQAMWAGVLIPAP